MIWPIKSVYVAVNMPQQRVLTQSDGYDSVSDLSSILNGINTRLKALENLTVDHAELQGGACQDYIIDKADIESMRRAKKAKGGVR